MKLSCFNPFKKTVLLFHYTIIIGIVKGQTLRKPETILFVLSRLIIRGYVTPGSPAAPKPFGGKDLGKKKRSGQAPWKNQDRSYRPHLSTQHERLLQRSNTLGDGQWSNLSAVLLYSDKLATWARSTAELYTPNSAENILISPRGIENINFAFITLEIEIVHHWWTFRLEKKKTS